MTSSLTNLLAGPALGALSFLIIGLFHPLVIKTEYYFGTRPWWLFALGGVALTALSVALESLFWSALAGIAGFSLFWSIHELFEQRERVRKGWFPMNPKRKHHYQASGADPEKQPSDHLSKPEN